MTTLKGRGAVALFVASALQCQDRIPETDGSAVPAPAATAVVPALTASVPRRPPSAPGEWVESLRYRLRVLEVTRCDEAASPTEARPNGFRLGVNVEVQATAEAGVSPVIASPGAATLENGGKVFRASAEPAPSGACNDLLTWQRLEPGQVARGFLIFEAPKEEYLRSSLLAFRPPRWSGELRVEVRLPDCFGSDCPRAPP